MNNPPFTLGRFSLSTADCVRYEACLGLADSDDRYVADGPTLTEAVVAVASKVVAIHWPHDLVIAASSFSKDTTQLTLQVNGKKVKSKIKGGDYPRALVKACLSALSRARDAHFGLCAERTEA